MNTFLSSGQLALQRQYLDFASQHVLPVAKALENQSMSLREFLQKLAQEGYLGITAAREWGGMGGSFLELVLFIEAISQFEPGLALTLAGHYSLLELIAKYGSDTQKSRYLPLLARGEIIGAVGFGEENAGTDFRAVESTVEAKGQGLKLNGTKTWVVNGSIAGLLAVLTNASELSMYLIDLVPSPTIKVSDNRDKLGLRSSLTSDLSFVDTPVSQDARLGAATGSAPGDQMVLYAMDISAVLLAAAAVGTMESATSHAAHHARTREQFGKPIAEFQGVQWKLADISTEAAASKLLTYRAAWAKDEKTSKFSKYASMSKLFACRAARLRTGDTLEILGCFGLSADSPLERFYRDSKALDILEGTAEFQKLRLAEQLKI